MLLVLSNKRFLEFILVYNSFIVRGKLIFLLLTDIESDLSFEYLKQKYKV
jgi:hypothetical protein